MRYIKTDFIVTNASEILDWASTKEISRILYTAGARSMVRLVAITGTEDERRSQIKAYAGDGTTKLCDLSCIYRHFSPAVIYELLGEVTALDLIRSSYVPPVSTTEQMSSPAEGVDSPDQH